MQDKETVSESDTNIQDRSGSVKRWGWADVRGLRLRLGLTQGQFAHLLDVERPTISNWETGKNDPSELNVRMLDDLHRRATVPATAHATAPVAPRHETADYWLGVMYAAEAMAETTHRLLREARIARESKPLPSTEQREINELAGTVGETVSTKVGADVPKRSTRRRSGTG